MGSIITKNKVTIKEQRMKFLDKKAGLLSLSNSGISLFPFFLRASGTSPGRYRKGGEGKERRRGGERRTAWHSRRAAIRPWPPFLQHLPNRYSIWKRQKRSSFSLFSHTAFPKSPSCRRLRLVTAHGPPNGQRRRAAILEHRRQRIYKTVNATPPFLD